MNFKKLALAAAAAAAATSAQAADLPVVAEPVNYVQACDAYGAGYFQLPGQETCIRVHGRIRTNWKSHNLTKSLGVTKDSVDAVWTDGASDMTQAEAEAAIQAAKDTLVGANAKPVDEYDGADEAAKQAAKDQAIADAVTNLALVESQTVEKNQSC